MTRLRAVLLDAGGVFLLPESARIVAAFARGGVTVEVGTLPDAHYRAAATFSTELDVDADWAGSWRGYLDAYVDACGGDVDDPEEVHRHLDSEFADAALWLDVIAGAVPGLRALADTGVALGVVSNADGLMAQRLRDLEILQVGPGLGVDVGAADTWYVGDMPAFDVIGARRAGLRPFLIDPLALHERRDYDRVASLTELAARVDAA